MEAGVTDHDRSIMLRAAVSKVGRDELKAALASISDPRLAVPVGVRNAANALRKVHDPIAAVGRTPYRAVVPFVAAAIADDCLARTIEELGDDSDDPTREQLLAALDRVRESFSDTTIAVMLASVADSQMPASDLCFDIVATDPRFDLTEWSQQLTPSGSRPAPRLPDTPSAEQREARRLKKQKDAEERKKKMAANRKAGEQVRRARKQERSGRSSAADPGPGRTGSPAGAVTPPLTRRATLTPAQEEEFDRGDPWAGGVVFVWVPFDTADLTRPELDGPARPDLEGKARRCVVVAGSATHLLVRPGYSEGGSKSRDWRSVPLRHWKRAGFDRPTFIDAESLRVPRDQVQTPRGWLEPDDWNALW